MGRIQATVGLVTGLPIEETVNKLIAIQARPRDLLAQRTRRLEDQRLAITQLTANLIALQVTTTRLAAASLYTARAASSSDAAVLAATLSGEPPEGTYAFTPLAKAQAQQWQSAPLASRTAALGGGTLSLRFGGFVDTPIQLDLLNGGQGVARGKLRITDRSGASAVIDLTAARNIDDVLRAINSQTAINVRAETVEGRIRLLDLTGQSSANLSVQEVDGGTTAASLGLAGINVAASQATGENVLRLFDLLPLTALTDGRGARFHPLLADLRITFRDNSTPLEIDFHRTASGSESPPTPERTLGDVLATLNQADPARLRASYDAESQRLVLEDLTTDAGGTFAVEEINGSFAARDLGINTTAAGNTITGRRLLSGLKTTLLASLNGGKGLSGLGQLDLQDRSGAQATIDLAAADTLDDVIAAINGAGIGLAARVNAARNGILVEDTTGSTAAPLVIANADATQTADRLQLAVNAAVSSKNSGNLRRQVVSEATPLASLHAGAGVATGTLRIADTLGASATLQVTSSHKTVGDVLKAIKSLGLAIDARINDAGDGIALVDTAHGSQNLTVSEGNSTTARDLRLLNAPVQVDIEGTPTWVIDGSTTLQIALNAADSLNTLVEKINAAALGVSATVINDGSPVTPYRLALSSPRTGLAAALSIDSSIAGLSFTETAAARDALLLFGTPNSNAQGLLLASATNQFAEVLPGLSVEVKQATGTPITVTVNREDKPLVDALQAMVDTYNRLRAKLKELTAYDATTNTSALLQGDAALLRVESDLVRLLAGRIGSGSLTTLENVGLSLNDQGELALDATRLKTEFARNPEAVKQLLATPTTGASDRFKQVLDSLVAAGNSLLVNRAAALGQTIQQNEARLAFMDERLEAARQRLLRGFQRAELAVARMQSTQSALASLQQLADSFNTRRTLRV
jgi:flagellar hook-associated protein 2